MDCIAHIIGVVLLDFSCVFRYFLKYSIKRLELDEILHLVSYTETN